MAATRLRSFRPPASGVFALAALVACSDRSTDERPPTRSGRGHAVSGSTEERYETWNGISDLLGTAPGLGRKRATEDSGRGEARDRYRFLSGRSLAEVHSLVEELSALRPSAGDLEFLAKGEDAALAAAAVLTAADLGPEHVSIPCRALESRSPAVALLAARSLGRARVPWTAPRLADVLIDGPGGLDASVRIAAAESLLSLGIPSGIPLLLETLKAGTRTRADASGGPPGAAPSTFEQEEAWRILHPIAGEGLFFRPEQAVSEKAKVIAEIERRIRGGGARIPNPLGEIAADAGLAEIVQRLLEWCVDHPEDSERASGIVVALGASAVRTVAERLHHLDDGGRAALLDALGRVPAGSDPGAGRALATLLPALSGNDLRAAARIASPLDDPALAEALLSRVAGADPETRTSLVAALIGRPGERIARLMTEEAETGAGALAALARAHLAAAGDPVALETLRLSMERDPAVRHAVIQALARIAGTRAAIGPEQRRPGLSVGEEPDHERARAIRRLLDGLTPREQDEDA